METLLILIIAGTLILGSYLVVNMTVSHFSEGSSETYGNYNKRKNENQAFSKFRKRIIKKTTQLRSKEY